MPIRTGPRQLDPNQPEVIRTPPTALRVRPHLADYAAERAAFT